MMRSCDGTDPMLLREVEVFAAPDQVPDPNAKIYKPCDCGLVFDDTERMLVYPHDLIEVVLS